MNGGAVPRYGIEVSRFVVWMSFDPFVPDPSKSLGILSKTNE